MIFVYLICRLMEFKEFMFVNGFKIYVFRKDEILKLNNYSKNLFLVIL